MSTINKALNYILYRNYEFCSLCFESVQGNIFSVYDEVVVKTKMSESQVKLAEILSAVLEDQAYSSISTFGMICDKCIKIAIKSYTFMKSATENYMQLSNTVEFLLNSLNVEPHDLEECRGIFISVDDENGKSKQIYDHQQVEKSIFTTNHATDLELPKIKRKQVIRNFNKKETKNQHHKLKSRKSDLSVTIPTSEMLYDKYNNSKLVCKYCLKVFANISQIRAHYFRVHAPKKFKCSTCNRKFGSRSLLVIHKNDNHCTHVCRKCGKTFNNRFTLRRHEFRHEGIQVIVCLDCGRTYGNRDSFRKHINLNVCGRKTGANLEEAKFTCDYCKKKFTWKETLKVHIQHEHGNYKNYECQWCKKRFWAQSRLKAHMVMHTQEKNFHCNICDGKFASKESLKIHIRTHTGEKPYNCEHCESSFASTSRKGEHYKRHHLEATLECDTCHCKFKTQLCLQKHKMSHVQDVNTGGKSDNANKDNLQIDQNSRVSLQIPENFFADDKSCIKLMY